MRILYGINGTGNGHRSRALELVPALKRHAEVDVLVSGARHSMAFPMEVRYRFRGLTFVYRDGGVAPLATAAQASPVQLVRDIHELDVEEYDAVVTDFESVSAWAARVRGIPCLHVSHQASFRCDASPRPATVQLVAETFMRGLIPCDAWIGLHFDRYSDLVIPPIVRSSVRATKPGHGDRVVVYLPSVPVQDQVQYFSRLDGRFVIFSSDVDQPADPYTNVRVEPASDERFSAALAEGRGVIGHAGFELPSEALYLGKPLFALPIARQYEQQCNAAALDRLGVATAADWSAAKKGLPEWLREGRPAAHLAEVTEPEALAIRIAEWVRSISGSRSRRGAA